jgi:OmpA-OmpF porin, OOP family
MRKLTIVLAAVLFAPSLAHADVPVEAGAFAGGHFFNSDNRLGRPEDTTGGTALQNTGAFGFRFGFLLHQRVELEAELLLAPTQTRDHIAQVLAFGWRGHVLVHLMTGRVRPFVLAGGGGMTSSSSDTNIGGASQDTKGELHLGAGLKVDITCRFGLRVDGRVQFGRATGEGTYFTEDGEVLLGLYGMFGKGIDHKCTPPAAAPKVIVVVVPAKPPIDSDGDGIPDKLDKCPTQPETKNGYQDDDGCPDEIPEAVKKFSGKVEGIVFANGKAVILPSSFPVLDRAAKVLKDYPQVKLEIQGHTDNVGDHDKNILLSQQRAEAVVKYLVDQGIGQERLTAKGYGPDKPVADNKTKAGKAANRRVEFLLVQ